MVQVILLDSDYMYCANVSKAITGKSKFFNCVDWKTYVEGHSGLSDVIDVAVESDFLRPTDLSSLSIAWDTTLVIYHPQHFYNAPEKAFQMVLTESIVSDIGGVDTIAANIGGVVEGVNNTFTTNFDRANDGACKDNVSNFDRVDTGGVPNIYKYSSMADIISTIEQFINDNPNLSENSTSKGLTCVAGDACPALRRVCVANLIKDKLENGFKIVEIDFCPPFMSDFITPAASGYTLSDALLRVIADDLSHEDIGLFLTPDKDGNFHFRCVERTDDLFECSPTHVRRFIETVIKWVKHTNFTYHVIINCGGVPFSFIYTISVMCDSLVLVNNRNHSAEAFAYNKELSYLLANLPGSCKVCKENVSCSDREDKEAGFICTDTNN
jgi:hypothetical protein